MKKLALLLFLFPVYLSFSQQIDIQQIATGFSAPLNIQNAGDDRLFIVEQGGIIKIIDNNTTLSTPFIDISSQVSSSGERGLLGLAFHPDYTTNGRFFVYYSDNNGDSVLSEFEVSSDAKGTSLTHLDDEGRARMVDVGAKPVTQREAVARGFLTVQPETLHLIQQGLMKKGDVLSIAQLAGIMGAKKTSDLIPLCHPLPLDRVSLDLDLDQSQNRINVTATASTSAKTGVEMEALTAVSVAALTVYDMCKSVDRGIRIEAIRLVRKTGGQSGDIDLEE